MSELHDPDWTLDQQRGEAVHEAVRQSFALIEALLERDPDDDVTHAILPRLRDLASAMLRAFDERDDPADITDVVFAGRRRYAG